jgi:Fe-S-cluster containining protein
VKLRVIQPHETSFPPLDRKWLAEICDAPLPVESRATCDDCAMLRKAELGMSELDTYFDPDSKCCTVFPPFENFRVGLILAGDGLARHVLEERIDARAAVTPLGVTATQAEYDALDELREAGRFGQSKEHRCPYYLDDGRCGVWDQRPSLCSTYHCRFVRGGLGADFARMLQKVMDTAETALARWCLLTLDIGDEALATLFPPKPTMPADKPRRDPLADGCYERAWGPWAGREREFYALSAERVSALSWDEIRSIAGPELVVLERALRRALAALHDDRIPDRLRAGRVKASSAGMNQMRVRAYSTLDTVDFPIQVVAALGAFDGRPTDEALAEAKQMFGTDIDRSMLQRMVDFRMLVPAGD